MPQNYSEFQLQRNRVAGEVAKNIATRAILIGVDIFKMILEAARAIIGGLIGK
jgi:hypothetical protein